MKNSNNNNEKCEKILKFYMLSNKLKNVIRTGWKYWAVEGDVRLESVAEHVFGTLMLAVSIYAHSDEYEDLDIEKVALMLALHETEEILIGDITMFDYDGAKTKKEAGRIAVEKMFEDSESDKFLKVIEEFESGETKEAKFAYMCDKLEADLQAYIYRNYFNMDKVNPTCLADDRIKTMRKAGLDRHDKFFLASDKPKFDGAFLDIANYLEKLEEDK